MLFSCVWLGRRWVYLISNYFDVIFICLAGSEIDLFDF